MNVGRRLSFKLFFQLIGIKSIYQAIYLGFVLVVMKSLDVADYGLYSYVLSLILFFSSIPLLGLPIYLQKKIAQKQTLHPNYLQLVLASMCVGYTIAYFLLPPLSVFLKAAVLMIIFYNSCTAVLVALNDGAGHYSRQYLYLLGASLWMFVCLVQYYVQHQTLSVAHILHYWVINSSLILLISLFQLRHYFKTTVTKNAPSMAYSTIALDLMLIYAVNIPDVFAKFFDKYLANHYLTETFLGQYSFNLMLVSTAYAFFVRPINSFLISQLSQTKDDINATIKVILNYYLFTLSVYLSVFLVYTMEAPRILSLLGLGRYDSTVYLFKICFCNMLFYILSYPFVIRLALHGPKTHKLTYSLTSLTLFSSPLILMLSKPTIVTYLFGFMGAYALNFSFIIYLQRRYSFALMAELGQRLKQRFFSIYHYIS